MNTVQLTAVVSADGILRLQIPVKMPNRKVEVLVVTQPVSQEKKIITECQDWPPGFFETTAGSFRDEPLERGDQGEYETRETLK